MARTMRLFSLFMKRTNGPTEFSALYDSIYDLRLSSRQLHHQKSDEEIRFSLPTLPFLYNVAIYSVAVKFGRYLFRRY